MAGNKTVPVTGNTITLSSPVERIVYQRNNQNKAMISVHGKCSGNFSYVEVRMVARTAGQGIATGWKKINITSDGSFSGEIEATGGWYSLEVRGGGKKFRKETARVERVGVGEVFIAVGHSVAQGGEHNAEGSADDRVSTVQLDEKAERFDKQYLTTGDPQYLPDPVFVQAASDVTPAPFGHGSYFWSKFGELVAKKENVPVLIYNAAFGGTNLDHWAKASQGIQFEHGFVRSKIRMPYINLLNTFTKYISLTGVRALLADHGQNDAGEKNAQKILDSYKTFIAQAREDLHFPQLALVVNRQMPENAPAVREAQEKMIREPNCFPGPDYNKDLLKEDKYDGIHLSLSGVNKAAALWANALTKDFFQQSMPYQPQWK
ncbi:MAG: sialate O-acetylesterase [Agriterribacter sp.]